MTDEETTIDKKFNLLDEPWIACLMVSGKNEKLSMTDIFLRACDVRRIAGDSPMQDYALLRVLLSAYWSANKKDDSTKGRNFSPAGWWASQMSAAKGSNFGASVVSYLEEYRDRFDLLDGKQPFMQVADLRTEKGAFSPVGRIIPEAESDYFTMRAGQGLESLAFDEAARWLIAVHAWDYSGIKSGAVGDSRVKGGKGYPIGAGWTGRTGGVVLHGDNLAETMVLNTAPNVVFDRKYRDDAPVWERPAYTAAVRAPGESDRNPELIPDGPCDILTWQARRVRLHYDQDAVTGVLVSNGDKYALRNQFMDPMTAYRYSKNQSSKTEIVHMPKGHSVERTIWRGLEPLLVRNGAKTVKKGEAADIRPATLEWLNIIESDGDLPNDLMVNVELVGVAYGNKDAVIEDSIHETLPVHLALLTERGNHASYDIVTAGDATMQVAIAAGQLAGNLNQAAGGEYAFVKDATESVLSSLEAPFKEWLAGVTPEIDMEAYRQKWFKTVHNAANNEALVLVRGAGPAALKGSLDDERLVSSATALSLFRSRVNKILGTKPKQELHDPESRQDN